VARSWRGRRRRRPTGAGAVQVCGAQPLAAAAPAGSARRGPRETWWRRTRHWCWHASQGGHAHGCAPPGACADPGGPWAVAAAAACARGDVPPNRAGLRPTGAPAHFLGGAPPARTLKPTAPPHGGASGGAGRHAAAARAQRSGGWRGPGQLPPAVGRHRPPRGGLGALFGGETRRGAATAQPHRRVCYGAHGGVRAPPVGVACLRAWRVCYCVFCDRAVLPHAP
jgi:hypothetical protein